MQLIKNTSIFLFLATFIISCDGNRADLKKDVEINDILVISAPSTFSFKPKKGIDSYVFELANDQGIRLHGDLGFFSYNLIEPHYPVFNSSIRDSVLSRTNKQMDRNSLYFSDYPDVDYDLRIFSGQYYIYDTINGIVVRATYPKRGRVGITGIYVPKLRDGRSFCLYTSELDSTHLQIVEDIFQSLRYK